MQMLPFFAGCVDCKCECTGCICDIWNAILLRWVVCTAQCFYQKLYVPMS